MIKLIDILNEIKINDPNKIVIGSIEDGNVWIDEDLVLNFLLPFYPDEDPNIIDWVEELNDFGADENDLITTIKQLKQDYIDSGYRKEVYEIKINQPIIINDSNPVKQYDVKHNESGFKSSLNRIQTVLSFISNNPNRTAPNIYKTLLKDGILDGISELSFWNNMLGVLLDKKLITRKQVINPKSNKKIYIYKAEKNIDEIKVNNPTQVTADGVLKLWHNICFQDDEVLWNEAFDEWKPIYNKYSYGGVTTDEILKNKMNKIDLIKSANILKKYIK